MEPTETHFHEHDVFEHGHGYEHEHEHVSTGFGLHLGRDEAAREDFHKASYHELHGISAPVA